MKNRNNLTRFFLSLLVLACIIQLVSVIPERRAFKKNGYFWPNFYRNIPENSLDIVYMGNSHANATFIPQIIDDILGTNSVHVGTSGESIYQTVFEYQEVLRLQNPLTVVIEANPIIVGTKPTDELHSWNYAFFYAMPLSFRKLIYAHQFFESKDLIYFYMPYTLFHSNWKDLAGVFSRLTDFFGNWRQELRPRSWIDFPDQGYRNYLGSLPPGEVDSADENFQTECAVSDLAERLAVVEKIVTIDREQGEDLLFVEAPQFVNEQIGCRDDVVGWMEAQQVDYRLLLQDRDYSRLWFSDKQHMSQFGAVIASVELADILAEKNGLEPDMQAEAFYETYFFKDYTLTRDGQQVTVELIPYVAENLSKLYFTWTLYRDGNQVEKVEGIHQNALIFQLPETSGRYDLDVTLYNLSGGYSLRGRFEVPSDKKDAK